MEKAPALMTTVCGCWLAVMRVQATTPVKVADAPARTPPTVTLPEVVTIPVKPMLTLWMSMRLDAGVQMMRAWKSTFTAPMSMYESWSAWHVNSIAVLPAPLVSRPMRTPGVAGELLPFAPRMLRPAWAFSAPVMVPPAKGR